MSARASQGSPLVDDATDIAGQLTKICEQPVEDDWVHVRHHEQTGISGAQIQNCENLSPDDGRAQNEEQSAVSGLKRDASLISVLIYELHHDRHEVEQQRRQYLEVQDQTTAALLALSEAISQSAIVSTTHRADLENLKDKALSKQIELGEYSRSLLSAEQRMAASERQLAEHVSHVAEWLARVNKPDNVTVTAHSLASTRICSRLDEFAMVEEYFHHAGQVFIMEERISELGAEHRQRSRSLEEGVSGCNIRAGGDDSDRVYRAKQQELENALLYAEFNAHQQRSACLARGLDPEDFRWRRLSAQDCCDSIEGSHHGMTTTQDGSEYS